MVSTKTAQVDHLHVSPLWTYVAVFVALLCLTATTVYMAFVNLGPLNNVVAMLIALGKAALVVFYFMHVRYSTRLIPVIVVAGIFWLVHLVGGSLSDYLTRGLLDVPGR